MNSTNTGKTDSGSSRSPSPSPPPQVKKPSKVVKKGKPKQTMSIPASAVVAKDAAADSVAMENELIARHIAEVGHDLSVSQSSVVAVAMETAEVRRASDGRPIAELTGTEFGGETTKKKYAGVAKWQMRGYDSKEEAEALGFYKRGDICEHCGKVFQRLYPKFLHYDTKGDTRCSGKLKRVARQQGKTSTVKIDDWVKKVSEAMVLLEELTEPYNFTAKDFMSWLTTDENMCGKGSDIILALNNKMFVKTALKKGVEEAPDVKQMGYALLPDGSKTDEYETAEPISFARWLDDKYSVRGDDSSWHLLSKKAREFDIDINLD
jgi:rRNA maturation endonuclease Nob1